MSNLLACRVAALAVALALAGCASRQGLDSSPAFAPFERTKEEQSCLDWLATLDAATDTAGSADAEARRLPGFPHLRLNRFLASFRDELESPEQWVTWLQHLKRLGVERRVVEISNLPGAILNSISTDRAAASARVHACGDLLTSADLRSSMRLSTLRNRAIVPDDYSLWQRAAGIYPLTSIPFLFGVRDWQQRTLEAFARARVATTAPGGWREYVIAGSASDGRFERPNLHPAPGDPLGIPVMGAQELQALAVLHAPIFNVETAASYDRFGGLKFEIHNTNGDGENTEAGVDIGSPAVYVRHDFTRYGKMTLLQLTYTLWFPQRPAEHSFDMLSGKLSGVMVRMTFAPGGEIVLVDSAHACGCYHLFFPAPQTIARPVADANEEWGFVPASLPPVTAGQRLPVWLASRTHYLVRIDAAEAAMAANKFSLKSNEAMLNAGVPSPGSVAMTRSLYLPNGLVAGSERGERYLFWPMGIASAGQMRQWGHHATAFVGRRHFDDAHLIEKYFEISFRAGQ